MSIIPPPNYRNELAYGKHAAVRKLYDGTPLLQYDGTPVKSDTLVDNINFALYGATQNNVTRTTRSLLNNNVCTPAHFVNYVHQSMENHRSPYTIFCKMRTMGNSGLEMVFWLRNIL